MIAIGKREPEIAIRAHRDREGLAGAADRKFMTGRLGVACRKRGQDEPGNERESEYVLKKFFHRAEL